MKGFLIAILVSATMLLLAAYLAKPRVRPRVERPAVSQPVAMPAARVVTEQVPEHFDLEDIPAHPSLAESQILPLERPATLPAPAQTVELAPGLTFQQEAATPADPQASDDELKQTIKETAASSTWLRNSDFPRTYISLIEVDLTSPHHWVRLTWSGPQAASQETGPFHSSPGRGLGYNNCDDVAESHRADSNCTPKGTMHVQAFSETMSTAPNARFVTWFNAARGVALHYYPDVPNYPASHGCVRLETMHVAQLIHNNSKIGATEVIVGGKWDPRNQ